MINIDNANLNNPNQKLKQGEIMPDLKQIQANINKIREDVEQIRDVVEQMHMRNSINDKYFAQIETVDKEIYRSLWWQILVVFWVSVVAGSLITVLLPKLISHYQ
ncbi:hypothetical protein [Moraxella marmotae]|uniref:hypothetical protein n=1 Tax=Moraxella marmotae TaxID=3344520 RepID=UPI0035F38993